MKPEFKLHNAALLMALAAAYPLHAQAAAGIAQFTAGDVTLRRGAGADALTKGRDIESGDAIVTGPSGRAQLRFTDGGLVSLQPSSQFSISNYADRNDPKQDSFFVELLRGGMRTITGLIGKRNRENFKVTTTTATIGIRGSAFNLAYNPDGTLSVSTELDEIEVCTKAGCVGLTAGESVRVNNNESTPVRTNTRASLPTPAPRQAPEVVGNQTTSDGRSAIVTAAPRVLVGLALAGYGIKSTGGDQGQSGDGAVLIDPSGNPERYVDAREPTTIVRDGAATTTVISNTGSLATGDLLVLGTWSAATLTDRDGIFAIAPVAFVTGVPTPPTDIAALSGQRGEYSLAHATPVFSTTGITGELLPSSKLSVDFLGIGNYVDVNLDVRMHGTAPTDYKLRGGAKGTGTGFAGVLSVSSPSCVQGSAGCGPATSAPASTTSAGLADFRNAPTGFVNGFLSGPNAANIGLSYGAYRTPHGDFGGAATFSKTSTSPTPSNNSLTDLQVHLVDGSGFLGGYPQYTDSLYSIVKPRFVGEAMTGLVNSPGSYYTSGGTTYTYSKTGTGGSFGAIGKTSDPDFIGWGNWVSGSKEASGPYGGSSQVLDSVHYLVGRPTPSYQMPISGTAQYALVGHTAPTATLGGTTITGTLLSASLSADFGLSTANVNISTQFGATRVDINIDATSSYGPASISGSTFQGCTATANVYGMFSGNMAYRAGLVYNATDPTVGRVAGSAVFQRTTSSALR